MAERLFDEKIMRKLEQLTLIASRVRSGAIKGERRSTRHGTSIEFADYREYARGDDLRRIDWNVFARLDRPFIKLLEEEEDLAVHILLDSSASMNWPQPTTDTIDPTHKFTFARRVVAGLAHISLGSGDRLTMTALRDANNAGNATWGPHRGRGRTLDLINFLERLEAVGTTDLNTALHNYAARTTRPGLCLIVSDLLSPGGYQDGLSALAGRGYEIALIHLLAPDEVNPPLSGDVRLIDSETGLPQDVSIDGALRASYTRRLLEWRAEIGTFAARRGIHYATVETNTAWEELILFELRRLGVAH